MDMRLSLRASVGLMVRPSPLILPDFRLSAMDEGESDLCARGFPSDNVRSGKVLLLGNDCIDFA